MDRFADEPQVPVDEAEAPLDATALGAGLAAVALAPAAVALLRLFPALRPDDHGLPWLLPAVGGATAMVLAAAIVGCLERGLRHASSSDVLRAVALGLLAVGLGVATLRSLSPEPRAVFPDAGLAVTAVVAGVVLLGAQLWRDVPDGVSRRSPATWLVVFGALEAGLAAALLVPAAGGTWPWLLG
ncbi:MAG TPA: hypothetical protein VHK63_03205, partial [Candidatus Limnocylindria bacterium]|nr:hypothetical protein [Candidatus Limnocylindria bacterium]